MTFPVDVRPQIVTDFNNQKASIVSTRNQIDEQKKVVHDQRNMIIDLDNRIDRLNNSQDNAIRYLRSLDNQPNIFQRFFDLIKRIVTVVKCFLFTWCLNPASPSS